MSAHRLRWLIFLSCGAALSVALAWVTWAALDLERRGHRQRVHNLEREALDGALARMDTHLLQLQIFENTWRYYDYFSFNRPAKAFTDDLNFSPIEPKGLVSPGPLLRRPPHPFRLYFTVMPEGNLTSPSVPTEENHRQQALEMELITEVDLAEAEALLAQLEKRIVPRLINDAVARVRSEGRSRIGPMVGQIGLELFGPDDDDASARLIHGQFAPCILPRGGEPILLLVREVGYSLSRRVIQGIWVDWDKLRTDLLRLVSDSFPEGKLRLVTEEAARNRLQELPFVFDPGRQPNYAMPRLTPTRLALLGLWVAVAAAAGAVGITLQKTLELSERRRSFVSAVTHELRTPLTTFCMYSEMLADGIVRDPHAQGEYFETLKSESTRLRRIVENVLGYARLEGRREERKLERIAAEELLDRILPALERRAGEGETDLHLDLRLRPDCAVQVDVQTVEQILFNLVDNACKYGVDGDKPLVLEAQATRDEVVLTVLDRGPGIPDELQRTIFEPFKRAAGDDEGIKPGIGLGLSLARGMARQMAGDVRLAQREGFGAAFELRLPLR